MLELFPIVRVSFWLVGAGRMPQMCAATPTLKLSTFSPKSGHFRWKRHFCEIISVDTHSTALFAPITILKNSKCFIQKKINFSAFCELSYFQSHSTENLPKADILFINAWQEETLLLKIWNLQEEHKNTRTRVCKDPRSLRSKSKIRRKISLKVASVGPEKHENQFDKSYSFWKFWLLLIISGFLTNTNSNIWRKTFGWTVKNAFISCPEKYLEEKIFIEFFFMYNSFQTLSGNVSVFFGKKAVAGLWKLLFKRPYGILQKNISIDKNIILQMFFDC